jgi:hypothetical protein
MATTSSVPGSGADPSPEVQDAAAQIRQLRTILLQDGEIQRRLSLLFSQEVLDEAFDVVRRLARRRWYPVSDGLGGAVLDPEVRRNEWYVGPDPDPVGSPRWTAIRLQLERQFGADSDVVARVDESSTRIVGLLGDPRDREFSRRGLVLGYVQSGKTTSFTAVAAKAADAGYKLVVVLSGIAENLRQQTQVRLDGDLRSTNVAEGLWLPLTQEFHADDADRDPDQRRSGDMPSRHPTPAAFALRATSYAVVKKNVSRLRNLRRWINSADIAGRTPILIIDDEADQASIDSADANDRSKRTAINRAILKILGTGRVSYLGYTATPFANLFVDPQFQKDEQTYDIYPRDFIVNLPDPGPHYFGTRRLFGVPDTIDLEEGEDGSGADVIRTIESVEAHSMRKWDSTSPAPTGLAEALNYFVLASAARRCRGQIEHSTMLVHSSQRVAIHMETAATVQSYLDTVRSKWPSDDGLRAELRRLWQTECGRYDPEGRSEFETFDDLVAEIPEVLEALDVIEENGRSDRRLVFGEEPRCTVAVGGNTLSRGLTLNGLVVSYFIRSASAYDALLQMGRWFGYRVGYADLPRVWMTEELEEQFSHLARVEIELREDLLTYQNDEDITPIDVAVRILGHPKLKITGPARMQRAISTKVDFGEGVHQTTHFDLTATDQLASTLAASRHLVERARLGAGEVIELDRFVVMHDLPIGVVNAYLARYPFHGDETWAGPGLMEYVTAEEAAGLRWNLAIAGAAAGSPKIDLGGFEVGLFSRSRYQSAPEVADLGVIRDNGRDEYIDLSLDPTAPALTAARRFAERLGHPRFGRHGLIVLYPIDKDSVPRAGERINQRKGKRVALGAPEHLLGMMLVFPKAQSPRTGTYFELDPELLDKAQPDELPPVDIEDDIEDEDE